MPTTGLGRRAQWITRHHIAASSDTRFASAFGTLTKGLLKSRAGLVVMHQLQNVNHAPRYSLRVAALMRVFAEELHGKTFAGALDFGKDGNKLYLGSLFAGAGKTVAALGALVCLALMLSMPASSWWRLGLWFLAGLAVYFLYGWRSGRLWKFDSPE